MPTVRKFLLLLEERIRWQWNASSVLQCSKKNGLCVVEVTEQQTALSEVHLHSELVTETPDTNYTSMNLGYTSF